MKNSHSTIEIGKKWISRGFTDDSIQLLKLNKIVFSLFFFFNFKWWWKNSVTQTAFSRRNVGNNFVVVLIATNYYLFLSFEFVLRWAFYFIINYSCDENTQKKNFPTNSLEKAKAFFFRFVQQNSKKFFHFWMSTSQPRSYWFRWSLESCDFPSTFAFSLKFRERKKIFYYYWLLILLAWIQCKMYAFRAMCCFLLSTISNFKGRCQQMRVLRVCWWWWIQFLMMIRVAFWGLRFQSASWSSLFFFSLSFSRPFNGNVEWITIWLALFALKMLLFRKKIHILHDWIVSGADILANFNIYLS